MEMLKIVTERAYLRSPSIHVGIKAEIRGRFSDAEFKDALELELPVFLLFTEQPDRKKARQRMPKVNLLFMMFIFFGGLILVNFITGFNENFTSVLHY